MKLYLLPLTCSLLATLSNTAIADDSLQPDSKIEKNPSIEEVLVWGRAFSLLGSADSASEGLVGYADFSTRPMLRVGELVEVIPGMVATQHSGSGKANQYFLRGMNLDHGTDFSVAFEGAPVNFRSHAHGQGYLDINFIIPEIVETISFRKGTYYADTGDFSGAGSSAIKTYDRLEQGFVKLIAGEDGYQRMVSAGSVDFQNSSLLMAAEIHYQDGPWKLPEDTGKHNFLLKYSTTSDNYQAQIIATAYRNSWNATDQIPQREVDAGRLSRFGYIDKDIGGETSRYSLIAKASTENLEATLYSVAYKLNLFSNPTYFLENRSSGDQIEQADTRMIYGGSLRYQTEASLLGMHITSKAGIEFRYDDISDTNLFKTTARRRDYALIDDEVKELSGSAYAEIEFLLTKSLRTTLGLRADHFKWDVNANVTADKENSGEGTDSIVSPKFTAAYALNKDTELYLSYGQGFHSNDVRGVEVANDPVDALVQIDGAEIGFRSEALKDVNINVAAFWLDTASELIFVGDAGTTEPSDGAKRFGAELSAFWQISDGLVFDLTAAKTKARFKGKPSGEDYIPDAHEFVAGAGLVLTGNNGITGSIRLRHFGSAPLDETDSIKKDSTTLVNLGLTYDFGDISFGLDVLNLFDAEANDIEFLFASQLENETEAVEDIHFHPVAPRSLRASARYQF